jgi:hypothetical protein
MPQLRTYLDRYPAKMVTHLADKLAYKYLDDCSHLLDPFCGSGAMLIAGRNKNLPVTGFDINPYAILLSEVKLSGFDVAEATELCTTLISRASSLKRTLPVEWISKYYWFTESTINKYEKLRYAAAKMSLCGSREGRAVLLAYALSVRRCSRADQRSPKPFISKQAIKKRKGRHFDPYKEIADLLTKLGELYGTVRTFRGKVLCIDLASQQSLRQFRGRFSHIITSPPYINAQDYFRNFKLELHLLENLLPFEIAAVKHRFIGTERGDLMEGITEEEIRYNRTLIPQLRRMEITHPRQAEIVHRYLSDMGKAFGLIRECLTKNGKLIVVCGDNLVGGYRVITWRLLNEIVSGLGFTLFDRFGDTIDCRNVPPKRNGHVGLIKQEVISAFTYAEGATE